MENSTMNFAAADENGLIERAKDGDREAFGELVRRHRDGLVDVVYRLYGDAALADDAAQTAFIRAWERLDRYQPHSAFRCWLYRIAVNAALDMLRRQKPTLDIDEISIVSSAATPEARVEQQQRCQLVRRAVLSLPEASRAVLVLREYGGLSYHEIAEALEIPTGTVMSRLNYARTRLLEWLSPHLEEV